MRTRPDVSNRQRAVRASRARVSRLVALVLARERSLHAVSVALVDDATIARLNEEHLGHEGPTDVIAFPLLEAGEEDGLLGEVVVSGERAREEARERGVPPEEEMLRYVVHGILHLLGYDDHEARARRRMWSRQERLLAEFLEQERGRRPRSRS